MNRVSEHRRLEEFIKPYGLTMTRERKHYAIRKVDAYVATVSHSPSDPHFARQTIRDLVRKGYLPVSVKGVKI